MFLGIAINVAVPPMHAWLPDAYPNSSVTGMVFMSGFTTKSAIYSLARGFHGWEVLIPIGVFMALYGMVYAVMATDIRKLLAYHIVSQVGFMVAGLGVAGEEAQVPPTTSAISLPERIRITSATPVMRTARTAIITS